MTVCQTIVKIIFGANFFLVTVCQNRHKIIFGGNFPPMTVCQSRPKIIFGANFPLVAVCQTGPKIQLKFLPERFMDHFRVPGQYTTCVAICKESSSSDIYSPYFRAPLNTVKKAKK